MITTNDILFSVLHSCNSDLESNRLIYYIYINQLAGLNYSFKYSINACGLTCRPLNRFISSLVNEDKISIIDGTVRLTKQGNFYYDNIILTNKEWGKFDFIKASLDNMSEEELYFICIVDMIVYDVLYKFGVDGLISEKDKIKKSISALSKEYSEDNFNAALNFIRRVKGEI